MKKRCLNCNSEYDNCKKEKDDSLIIVPCPVCKSFDCVSLDEKMSENSNRPIKKILFG